MEKLLLHITELASWVSSGRLTVNLSRLIDFSKNNNEYCFRQMLEEFGNVRPGDPEAYVIATLKTNWRSYLIESQNNSKALFQTIELAAVSDIQALTNDSAIRLGSQIERLAIKLTSPKFEILWTDYQKQRFDQHRWPCMQRASQKPCASPQLGWAGPTEQHVLHSDHHQMHEDSTSATH